MDGDERRNPQYGQQYNTPGSTRPAVGQPMGPPSTDRYVQPSQSPARSDVGRSSITRPYASSYGTYGYHDQYAGSQLHSSSPMQGVEMQYSPAYVQDPSRSQQIQQPPTHQPYAQYGHSSMIPTASTHTIYDTMPHYQQRQSAAIEVMASQFAMPNYSMTPDPSSVPTSSQYMTSQSDPSMYGNPNVTRASTLQSSYSTTPMDFPPSEHQPGQEQADAAAQAALAEGFTNYEQQIRNVVDLVNASRLTEATAQLLAATRWLVDSIVPLGLHHDDESKHAERIALWRNLNLCWEALGQKQKNITEQALRTRQQPINFMSAAMITDTGEQLIAMCDQIEQYGLVDYELGIWEEQILHLFATCLGLLQQGDNNNSSATGSSSRVGLV